MYLVKVKDLLIDKKMELENEIGDFSFEFVNEHYSMNDSRFIDDVMYDFEKNLVDKDKECLLDWVRHNYEFIEEYVDMFGIKENEPFDFIELIKKGQYFMFATELNKDETNIKKLIFINKLLNLDPDFMEQEIDDDKEIELVKEIDYIIDGTVWVDFERFNDLSENAVIILKELKNLVESK
jgi:hypothetical protein